MGIEHVPPSSLGSVASGLLTWVGLLSSPVWRRRAGEGLGTVLTPAVSRLKAVSVFPRLSCSFTSHFGKVGELHLRPIGGKLSPTSAPSLGGKPTPNWGWVGEVFRASTWWPLMLGGLLK